MNSAFLISSIAWQGVGHSEAIAEVRSAGFGGVEILCKPGHFEYDNVDHVEQVNAALDDWPDAIVTFHAPFYGVDLASADPAAWDHAVAETIRALEAAATIRAENMTLHVRSREQMREWSTDNFAALRRSLSRLVPAASERDITLSVENLPPRCFTAAGDDILRLIEPFPTVGTCIDTGHAHLAGTLIDLAHLLAPRAFVAHLHDNIGHGGDKHLIPGEGTITWREFVEAMRRFRGRPVVEVVMVGTLGETLDRVKRAIVETGLLEIVGA